MKNILFIVLLLSFTTLVSAQKKVYIPKFITTTGMDLTKTTSQWCYARSKESENIVIFWEAGFGTNPSTASDTYRVNMDTLLKVSEKTYALYVDSLKFAIKGASVVDKYKLMIFLLYSTVWAAYGSGQDDSVGSLQVNPAAANISTVVAHELGHCFEYITGCDAAGGYRYGFGANTSGGNGFWEQCAQWMSYKVYPDQQFTNSDFLVYVKSNHLHILHETPRYANYFLPDYWTYKHDKTFLGRLWRNSRSPEDPVESYMRLNAITQAQFNDEIFEHASRLTTWDIPAIKSYGQKYIDSRDQIKMTAAANNFWLVDPSVCIQNYGYNSIKLNVPSQAIDVAVRFQGKTGTSGFRAINTSKGGWRFGFVALLKDSTRKYSDMQTANVATSTNPDITLSFNCPANCSKLWLVVSGAPQNHWRHAWDDDSTNDEQWPYQVQFTNTNLLGKVTQIAPIVKENSPQIHPVFANSIIHIPENVAWKITDLTGKQIVSGYGKSISIHSLANGGYILRFSGRNFNTTKSFVIVSR